MIEDLPPRATPREARGGHLSDGENGADTGEGESDAAKRRQPKKRATNIFKSFSDSYNDLAYLGRVEVENGRVKHFVQARRFWQSESDLARWQQSLKDASRHCRSLDSIGARCNPNWHEERVELLMSHNESSRKRPDRVPTPKTKVSPTMQLRELQQKILPAKAAAAYRRQRAQADKTSPTKGSEGRAKGFKEDRLTEHDEEVATNLISGLQERYSSTTALFQAIDVNGNGILSLNEFSRLIYSQYPELQGSHFSLSNFWATMDLDEDGIVDSKEFEAKMQPIWKRASREKRRFQREQKAWTSMIMASVSEDAHALAGDKGTAGPERSPSVAPEAQPKPKAPPPLAAPAQLRPRSSAQPPAGAPEAAAPQAVPAQQLRRGACPEAASAPGKGILASVQTSISEGALENVAYSLFLVEVGRAQAEEARADAPKGDRWRPSRKSAGGGGPGAGQAAGEGIEAPAAAAPPAAAAAARRPGGAPLPEAPPADQAPPARSSSALAGAARQAEDQEEGRRRGPRVSRSASKLGLEELERGPAPTPPPSKCSTALSRKRSSLQVQIATKRGALKELPSVRLPQTMTLLVFRNADPTHCGEPVFVKRWPLSSLKELLTVCSAECRPFVGPAEALLTPDLAPLRSLEDVTPGAALLLKGAEGLDPPPLFFLRRELPGTRSLGQLTRARADVASAEFYELFRQSTPLRELTASLSCASSPQPSATFSATPHGSPPRLSQGDPVGKAPRTGRWKEPPGLSMKLARGGLCRKSSHHDFSTWGRALDHHGRSADSAAGAEGAFQTMAETL